MADLDVDEALQTALALTTLAQSHRASRADVVAAITDPFNETGSVVAGFEFLTAVISRLATLHAAALDAASAVTGVPADKLLQCVAVDLQGGRQP